MRQGWAADILELACSRLPEVPSQVQDVIDIGHSRKRYREGHDAFSAVRELTLVNDKTRAGGAEYAALLVTAENAAKVIYNGSGVEEPIKPGEKAPFDDECGYWLAGCLSRLVEADGSPHLKDDAWRVMATWLRRAARSRSSEVEPSLDPAESRDKLCKELCIFFAGLGLLLAIAAWFMLMDADGNRPPLWGFPRHLAIGVPLAIVAALHLLSGALLALSRAAMFALGGAIVSTLFAVFYFVFMISATGTPPINLISLVVIAIPILVWGRTGKFLSIKSTFRKNATNE
jgi:hypothetical protein